MCNVWGARYITPNGQREQIGSFRHGSMANALPHAIGAQFADRDRQVISFNGDGGLAMLLGELLTVKLRSEEHTSELQSRGHLVCRLLLETKKAPRRTP